MEPAAAKRVPTGVMERVTRAANCGRHIMHKRKNPDPPDSGAHPPGEEPLEIPRRGDVQIQTHDEPGSSNVDRKIHPRKPLPKVPDAPDPSRRK